MERLRLLRGTVLGVGIFVATACGGVDDGATDPNGDVQVTADALRGWRFHHHPPGTGGATSSGGTSTSGGTTSTGGTSTSGGTTSAGGTSTSGGTGGIPPATCELCTITQDCCNAVNAGALCTFSADTCSAYDPDRRHTYAVDCLVTLRTIISAWELAGRAPPAVCALPQQ